MEVFVTPLLYIVIAINAILAVVILSRGLGNKVNTLFGLIVFATALWGAGILGFYEDLSGTYWLTVTHLSSLFLAYLFYIFTTFYPTDTLRRKQRVLFTFPIIIATASSLSGDLIYSPTGYIQYQLGGLYLLFAFVVASYFILGFYNLFVARSQAKDTTTRGQVNAVLFGSSLAATLAMVTDLVMPYFGVFNYTWLGPFFTIFLITFMFRAIFKYHLFDIKVIATELLTFILWLFILVRTLVATNMQDRIANGTLLAVSVIIGILLIRSVLKEVHQREEIQALAERLKSVNSILAHDVKGAFGKGISAFSMLIGNSYGPMPKEAQPLLKSISRDWKRMLAVITNILAAGRDMVLTPESFNLKDAVLGVLEETKGDAEIKNHIVNTNIPAGSYTITADKTQLTAHVLKNLIENAINYTPEGGMIVVGLSQKDPETILFTVKDNGVGIKEVDRPNMFKEGGRGKDSPKINVHSSGYGLVTAKKTVDAHKGKIWFESEGISGKGTTFIVELPVDPRAVKKA